MQAPGSLKSIRGQLYEGAKSEATNATLYSDTHNINVQTEDGRAFSFPRAGIKVSDRVGNIPRWIYFPDSRSFVTEDNDAVDLAFKGKVTHAIFRMEKSLRVALLGLTTIAVLGVLLYLFALPALAKTFAPMVPKKVTDHLSEESVQYLKSTKALEPTKLALEQLEKLTELFEQVRTQFPDLELKISVHDGGGMGANAFALPDGTILVTDELAKMATADELKAVLYHEVGHIRLLHLQRALIQQAAISVALLALGGTDALGLPLVLLSNTYSRGHEEEADLFAAEELHARDLEPVLLGQILEKMEKASKLGFTVPAFLSTHPLTEERMKKLRNL